MRLARLRLNGDDGIRAFGEISDQHLISKAHRAILSDWRWLRQKGHIQLRCVRVSGESRHHDKEVNTKWQKAHKVIVDLLR